jgi:hypothetical protein
MIRHDPDATLDYRWDWAAWLAEGETISTYTVLDEDGPASVDTTSTDGQTVTAWVSASGPGRASLTCRIVTNQGRTDDRTIRLFVADR